MNTEILIRPNLIIAILDDRYVGVAPRAPGRPDHLAEKQALRQAMSQRQAQQVLSTQETA